MGDLTQNLSQHEFDCKCTLKGCTHKETADFKLVSILQKAVDHFAQTYGTRARVIITSGNRCPAHNHAIGGAAFSRHIQCNAADFYVQVNLGSGWVSVPTVELYHWIDDQAPNSGGLKNYGNRVHYDTRQTKWRSA